MSIFKKATRIKLRFQTSKGLLSVEQLWSLSQEELSGLITKVYSDIKKSGNSDSDELSFLKSNTKVDEKLQLAFDILKDVYTTIQSENEESAIGQITKAKNAERKEELTAALKEIRGEKTKKMTEEEILKELGELS